MASTAPPQEEPKKAESEPKQTPEIVEAQDAAEAKQGMDTAVAVAKGNQETQAKVVDNSSSNQNPLDFSNRKVIVYNIDKFMKAKHLEKIVQGWIQDTDIIVEKKKKPPRNNWVVLTLEKESMVGTLVNILNDGKHKNKKGGLLRAQRPIEGSNDGKRSRDGDDAGMNSKRLRSEPVECVKTPDEVRDKLTPFWKMSYEDQLDAKTKMIVTRCLSKIVSEMKKKFQTLLKEQRKNNGGKKAVDSLYGWLKGKNSIVLDPILAAPRTLKYRNKCELTFGYSHSYQLDENGQPIEEDASPNDPPDADAAAEKKKKINKIPAVGFMAGGWAGGVSDPHGLSNIPDVVCGIADVINKFLQTSPVPPYDAKLHRGVWRTVTIRSSERTKQCMIIIVHAPASGGAGKRDDGSDDYTAEFDGEKKRLVEMLKEQIPYPVRTYASNVEDSTSETKGDTGDDKKEYCDIQVTSLFFQEFAGLSNPAPDHPVQHIDGKEFIEEKLLQCEFQISPGAFFQVTTEGAEQLYSVVVEKVKEVTPNPKDTLLFDVCCGTGTIGLTCMKEGAVGKVVGIDISEPAIKDAIINAERNGYSGSDDITRFIASKAEYVMHKEVTKVQRGCPMVAVVDPARDGLHPDVIKALRNQRELQRIVYVSCNPTGSLVKDACLLCSPPTKKYRGLPFKIASSRPADMFPLTDHCEMVMVFDRMTQKECDGDEKNDNVDVKPATDDAKPEQDLDAETKSEEMPAIEKEEKNDNVDEKPETDDVKPVQDVDMVTKSEQGDTTKKED